MEPKNEQTQNNQATNEQPKKTWIEPELVSLGDVVESGKSSAPVENATDYYVSN